MQIGPAARHISGCSLYNSGICTLLSADLTLENGAMLKNESAGLFEIGVSGIIRAGAGTIGSFNNLGLLRKAIAGDTLLAPKLPRKGRLSATREH
jgi:hypothetical protein